MQIFAINVDAIDEHNEQAAKGLHTFTRNLNQFSDLTHEEKKVHLGLRGKSFVRNKRGATTTTKMQNTTKTPGKLPASVDWRKIPGMIQPVRDQGILVILAH